MFDLRINLFCPCFWSRVQETYPATGRKKWDDSLTRGFFPQTSQTMVSAVLILAAAQHHPPVLSYLPTRRKRQCMGHRWVRVAEVWRVSLITDDGGDGRQVYSSLIFVSAFYMASSPLRPKIVILLEIVIIIISFKDADLLYYLLPNVFTEHRRVWGTMVAVERRQPPSSWPTSLIFACVVV